jgi:hypothetical protein
VVKGFLNASRDHRPDLGEGHNHVFTEMLAARAFVSRGRIIPAVADEKALAILKQGAEAWNEWRMANPGQPNLSRADLRVADLREVDITTRTSAWRTSAGRNSAVRT